MTDAANEVGDEGTAGAIAPARDVARRGMKVSAWLSWGVAVVAVVAYLFSFAAFVRQESAIPYYDSTRYLRKTFAIAEGWERAGLAGRINPQLYFGAEPVERPPLLMTVAAVALGPRAELRHVAWVWMAVRVGVILLALWLLARAFGDARFVGAAALVILATPVMRTFVRMYMMDEPFGAFALLAVALVVVDDRRRTAASAAWAGVGMVLLLLVKPVAPSLLAPVLAVRAGRGAWPAVMAWRRGESVREEIRRAARWGMVYAVALAVMAAIVLFTPYGEGIRWQYGVGAQGWWTWNPTWREMGRLITFLVPPWVIVVAAVVALVRWRGAERVVLLYAASLVAWWVVFSFYLTYTVEDRLIGQAMPAAVALLLMFVCRGRNAVAVGVTAVAAVFFGYSTARGAGWVASSGPVADAMAWVSPAPGHRPGAAEVGLVEFARRAKRVVSDAEPRGGPVRVLSLQGNMYTEPGALNLALREANGRRASRVTVEWAPPEAEKFDLAVLLGYRWFVTTGKRADWSAAFAENGLFRSMGLLDRLVTDGASPVKPVFRRRVAAPIRRPWETDELVLWERVEPVTDEAVRAAAAWLLSSMSPTDPRRPVLERQARGRP